MNIATKLKRITTIGLVFGVFAAAIAGAGIIANHTTPVAAAYACDKINVIYCGIDGTTTADRITSFQHFYDNNTSGTNGYKDIQTIYNYSGIGASKSLVDTMAPANTVHGAVYKNGDVKVNGVLIATNARSVGRFWTTGSTSIAGTNAYIRSTTYSFASDALSAIIRLDANGSMIFGALLTCGNAFTATPVPIVPPVVTPPVVQKPAVVTPIPPVLDNYTVTKLVALKGSTAFAPSISVLSGSHVVYSIVVSSTGSVPVTSLAVHDTLPSNVNYVTGTLKRDGVGLGTAFFDTNNNPSSGIRIISLANGTSTVFTYEVVVGPNDTATACTIENNINNVATISQGVGQGSVYKDASGNWVIPQPLPTLTSTATVNKTCPTPPTVPKPTVAVPTTTTNTNTNTVTIINNYVYVPVPQTVVAACTNLSLVAITGTTRGITATVTYSASSGVNLNNVSFNWNDGYITNNGIATSAQHTYIADGTYNVLATLSFSSGSINLPQATCQLPVSFSSITPVVVTPVIKPVVPGTLVNTGPGDVVGMFAGISSVGAFGYRFFLGRRLAGAIAD